MRLFLHDGPSHLQIVPRSGEVELLRTPALDEPAALERADEEDRDVGAVLDVSGAAPVRELSF